MDELKEAKAKHASIRERRAAKRQQWRELIAGINVTGSLKLKSNKPLVGVPRKTESPNVLVSSGPLVSSRNTDDTRTDGTVSGLSNRGRGKRSSIENANQLRSEKICKTATSHTLDSGDTQSSDLDPKCSDSVSVVSEAEVRTATTSSHTPMSTSSVLSELEDLLGAQTAREKESKRIQEEILALINTPSSKERFLSEKFRSQGGSQVQQFCAQGTRVECAKYKSRTGNQERCTKLHFRKIIHPHTDESLGDCSFLNTCFHVDTCKYVHYTIDYSDEDSGKTGQSMQSATTTSTNNSSTVVGSVAGNESDRVENEAPVTLYPPQWINCDIRLLNMSILGKFAVIMADPPWDIHMELPYGTMSDDEMRRLDIPCLQDDGYIFLWVTGRAMELGRECLRLWGYQRVDEIIWVKTNQLQRLIRTGRTGHWLNHGKEHCLVGVKGKPQSVNRGLDCDVIVSEVRETSHKPDEIYGLIERLSPGTRKLELFGRPHNLQPNWITLGNQLDGTYLVDPVVVERFKKHYPNGLEMRAK